jgi:alkaline phosphatase
MWKWLLFALASALLTAACAGGQGSSNPPHVILFIGDGMGYGSEVLASRYLSGSDTGLAWRGFPFQAWAATWDVDTYNSHAQAAGREAFDEATFDPSLGYDSGLFGAEPWPLSAADDDIVHLCAAATDSAASATAMATGRKTDSGKIAWSRSGPSSPGGPLQTIAELMRIRLGSRVGVVTTVPFDHATPAAFAAHTSARSSYADIASQMTASPRPDVVAGGGHPAWCGGYFGTAELATLRASPLWSLAERRAGVDGGLSFGAAAASAGGKGLFGLFGGADGSMETPVPANAPGAPFFTRSAENPSLAVMAVAAARLMSAAPGGFFLMAEQGDIDWANHENDLPRMVGAVCSLDEAVRAVEAWVDEPGDGVDWGNTLLIVTADHATGIPRFSQSAAFAAGEVPARTGSAIPYSWTYAGGSVSYSTGGHGNELVTVAARGDRASEILEALVGKGRPGTRIIDDTDIYLAMRAFAGM